MNGDFPGGSVVKNLPANAGNTGSIPCPGRFHMPRGSSAGAPQLLKPVRPRAHPPQREKSLQWEDYATWLESSPYLGQLEKSLSTATKANKTKQKNQWVPLHANNVFRRVDACPKSELCAIFPNTKILLSYSMGCLKWWHILFASFFNLNFLCTFYCLLWKAWSPFLPPAPCVFFFFFFGMACLHPILNSFSSSITPSILTRDHPPGALCFPAPNCTVACLIPSSCF